MLVICKTEIGSEFPCVQVQGLGWILLFLLSVLILDRPVMLPWEPQSALRDGFGQPNGQFGAHSRWIQLTVFTTDKAVIRNQ